MEVGAWLAKRQTLSATLLLILALHLCFFPFIWGNRTLLTAARGPIPSIMPNGAWYGGSQGPAFSRGNDAGGSAWLLEPDAALVHYQYFREKHLPLWNPYQSYGAPLAANMQSQPFNPLFFLFALQPGPRTFNFFIFARLLLTGFCTYLYLRLFLPFVPSVAGGIACMLSGYYILFFNMPELSVNILIPAVFLATERLLRSQSIGNLILSIAVTFLCIVGGMPESAFLVLAFGGSYFLFRLAVGPRMRAVRSTQLKYFVFAQVMGLVLAAFLLVPFFEFMKLSFDSHQPANMNGLILGLKHDVFGLSLFTYVIPGLFGPAWNAIGPGLGGYDSLRGYMGVVQILLAIVAIGSLFLRQDGRFPGERRLMLFFFVSALTIVLKRYGAPVINWIGYLPFCQLIQFPKYEEPLLAFTLSVLCAFGMHQVLAATVNRRRLLVSLLIVFAVLFAALAFSLPGILAVKAPPYQFYLSLAGGAGVLFLSALLLIGPDRFRNAMWLPAALLALLTAEMAANYIYPLYYVPARSAGDDANPYRGAPYIDYLKARSEAHERVFAREGILHPGWAGAFQLDDIRGLDAMYYRKYFDFIRFFLQAEIPAESRGDLINRFTGLRWLPLDSPLKMRLLQLSSVRFLVSLQPYITDSGRGSEILGQNKDRLLPGRENLVEARTFTISGETKAVLYEHPPYERLPFRTTITPASREFSFDVAMQPAVYDGSLPVCGGGVEFRLEVRDSGGRIRLLYDRYIDPKHDLAERRWIPGSVDLNQYMGQIVELLFTTRPGPTGDTCAAWAGWGDPHFNGDSQPQTAFRLIDDHGVKIYRYQETLPRASLFSDIKVASDDASALAALGSPALDIFQTAVVSLQRLNAAEAGAIQSLHSQPHERARAARIISYTSQEVVIDAATERLVLLVLNDSDYPGWKVYVDGRRSRWITANYLFRGVLLQPGRRLVRFAYEPASFTAGATISGAGLLGLAGFIVWRRRRADSGVAKSHLV